jgi:hypothetical protein
VKEKRTGIGKHAAESFNAQEVYDHHQVMMKHGQQVVSIKSLNARNVCCWIFVLPGKQACKEASKANRLNP